MPLVQVKVFEDELSPEQAADVIARITDAMTAATSEKLRDKTWVVIEQVRSGFWGIGGAALGLDDVKRLIAGS